MTPNTLTAPAPQISGVPDFEAIKKRQQTAWSTGNYSVVGTTLQIVGEQLAESLDLRSGSRVLDVAAGNGNATLAAARRFCDVVSTDYVPALLEAASVRAMAEGVPVQFREADAENLPFDDASFDAVVSTFGVMFTPNQARAAAEMARVCRPGGRIGLANWTPESFIGELFKLIGRYVPPAAGLRSPSFWGTREGLDELFAGRSRNVRFTPREFVFRYRSPLHFVEIFRTFYGPMNRTYAALDTTQRDSFTSDLLSLIAAHNRSGDETLVLPSAYAEVVIER